jgi:peptidoglycan/xylan/chitin deacetylase (PgdA/CDA1 family)|tara:strand:+ start:2099 stop:3055 length:957 start_codon:yes stop_codon:yes gene_type:complete
MNFSGLISLAHFVNRKKPKILMFHRISDGHNKLGIDQELFEAQIGYIAKNFDVISMKQMVDELRSGTIHNNAVAITFDDGHADFYKLAWPMLKRYKLSATLYITTGFIDQTCWLWPDALRYMVENTKEDNCRIDDGSNKKVELAFPDSAWSRLADYALSLGVEQRQRFLEKLSEKLNVPLPDYPVEPYFGCSWSQIREMVAEGLDVGSHSITHPILSALSKADLEKELYGSGKKIEKELGFFPEGICYPNGAPQDISEQVIESAKILGYQYGLMAYPCGVNSDRLMTLGRYPAPTSFNLFQRMINGISRVDMPKEMNR